MEYLGIYVFNSTRNAWLQDDARTDLNFHTWGPFDGAREFHDETAAENARLIYTSGDDVSFTMAALH